MILHDECTPLRKVLATNSVDASFTAIPPTVTEPLPADLTGVIDVIALAGTAVPKYLLIMPYILGANNETFSVRVTGWAKVAGTIGTLWVPTILAEYDVIGGADASCLGVAGSDVLATERFVDTLTIVANSATDGQGVTKVSPANDTPGHILVALKGCRKFQVHFKKGTGTSGNALYRTY